MSEYRAEYIASAEDSSSQMYSSLQYREVAPKPHFRIGIDL